MLGASVSSSSSFCTSFLLLKYPEAHDSLIEEGAAFRSVKESFLFPAVDDCRSNTNGSEVSDPRLSEYRSVDEFRLVKSVVFVEDIRGCRFERPDVDGPGEKRLGENLLV